MAEWIRAKDRLPTSGKRVLAFIPYERIIVAKWLGGVGCWINEKNDVVHVIYWKPLPEPPKGE